MADRCELSVVMPVHNGAHLLALTLEALSRQSFARDCWELVLVDDGSDASVAETTSRFDNRLNIKRLRLREQQGRAGARNAGIAASRGRVLVLLDADMFAHVFASRIG